MREETIDEVTISTGGVLVAEGLHTLKDAWPGVGNAVLNGL